MFLYVPNPIFSTPLRHSSFLSPNHSIHPTCKPSFALPTPNLRSRLPVRAAQEDAPPPPPIKKRLCVFSDGTWDRPQKENDTHILLLSRALQFSDGHIKQIVFYDEGVGTEGLPLQKLTAAAVGRGIDKNIIQLYSFLSLNYEQGDEIYLFGYSRGAYTVRSLAGLIYEAGLVRRQNFDYIENAYDLYRNQDVAPESQEAISFRAQHGSRVPITLLACFDTVGALGIPYENPAWLRPFLPDWHEKYRFHDTELGEHIEHAVHMVSIDESSRAFKPTLMETKRENVLVEKYFPGGHATMGGGNAELDQKRLSANTLRFLFDTWTDDMKLGLKVDEGKIPKGGVYDVPPRGRTVFGTLVKAITGEFVRTVDSVDKLHSTAIKRFQKVDWRPLALAKIEGEILKYTVED